MGGPSESPARPARYSFVLKLDAASNDGTRPRRHRIRDQVFAEFKDEIVRLATEGIRPALAALLVGEILPPTLCQKQDCRMLSSPAPPSRVIRLALLLLYSYLE